VSVTEHQHDGVELSFESDDDFTAMYAEVRGVSGLDVEVVTAPARSGEQGSIVELLTVACSGGALTVLLQIVRNLVESRGPGFVLKARCGRDRIEITADNLETALPLLEKLFDDDGS